VCSKIKGERYRRGKGKSLRGQRFFYLKEKKRERKRIRGGRKKKKLIVFFTLGPRYSMRTAGLCRTNGRVCEGIALRCLATVTCLLACVGRWVKYALSFGNLAEGKNRKSSTSFPQRQIERTIFLSGFTSRT